MNKIKYICLIIWSTIMATIPYLSMEVSRTIRPSIEDLGGYIHQIIGRFFYSIQIEPLTMTFVFIACFCIGKKALFKKLKHMGKGQYILSGFLTIIMLIVSAMRTGDSNSSLGGSISILWENSFQLMKVVWYIIGYFPLFLCVIRILDQWLNSFSIPKIVPNKSTFWDKHPFLFPFLLLSLVWGSQAIIRYPGVINVDIIYGALQYLDVVPKTSYHGPIHILIYGYAFDLGLKIRNVNLIWFCFAMFQVVLLLLSVSAGLCYFKKNNIPKNILTGILVVFCISPIYSGWDVALGKDGMYMILNITLVVLLLFCLHNPNKFLSQKRFICLYFLVCLALILTRGNGIGVFLSLSIALFVIMCKNNIKKTKKCLFIFLVVVVSVLPQTIDSIIINKLNIPESTLFDYLSLPFQQTARVAKIHGDTLNAEEKEIVNTFLDTENLPTQYNPVFADPVKVTTRGKSENGTNQNPFAYLKVWFLQGLKYPITYTDAFFNMNYKMFDLNSNEPMYYSYTDINIHTETFAFVDTHYFDLEQIRPLLSYQYALVKWYHEFAKIPLIGNLISVSFNTVFLIIFMYIAYVNNRKRVLIVCLPAFMGVLMGLAMPVYIFRYLLPIIATTPLCVGSYYLLNATKKEKD